MSEWKQRSPTLWGMVRAGGSALRRYTGLTIVVYLVQLALSGGAAYLMARVLANAYAMRPEFDRGVDGDAAALITALVQGHGIIGTLLWIGLVTAGAYWLVSWAIAGGLITTFIQRPYIRRDVAECFGRGAAGCFFPFVRLAAWSVIIYLPAGVALFLGAAYGLDGLGDQLTLGGVAWKIVYSLGPGLALFAIAGTIVDYARVDLARHPGLASRKALVRNVKLVLTRVRPIAHVAFYLLFFASVSGAYVAVSFDRPMIGAMGALSLFILRQVVVFARLAANVMLIGGQVELSQMQLFPPRKN